MTQPPQSLLTYLTRHRLAEVLAATYARLANVDANEASRRLFAALSSAGFIAPLQQAIWDALLTQHPKLEPDDVLKKVAAKFDKETSKPKRYRELVPSRNDEGAVFAFVVAADSGAGLASGESLALLESAEGQALLSRGTRIVAAHVAKEVVR